MSTNSLLNPSMITKETLMILANNLVFAGKVNRQFENQFVKIGQSITVRKPNRFTVRTGAGIKIQNLAEPSTSITIGNQIGVDWQFSSADLTLTIEEFTERYTKPAAEALANNIDQQLAALYTSVYNMVGTPGTVPNSFASIAAVGQRMDEGGVPQEGRVLVLGPAAYWSLATALTTLYVKAVAEPALKGFLANIANFEIYEDQNAVFQTVGNWSGSPVVNGASQTGSSLITNGWTASVTGLLNVGDVFTISGVYAVNPQSRTTTGSLQNFVVTSTANSDSGGNSTIGIYPAIITSGAYQTVSASPANLAPITVKGVANTSYQQNIGFVRDAFGLVCVPMELPDGVDFKAREMVKGISMRIIRFYDGTNDVMPCRMDVLFGVSAFYPELAVRLTN